MCFGKTPVLARLSADRLHFPGSQPCPDDLEEVSDRSNFGDLADCEDRRSAFTFHYGEIERIAYPHWHPTASREFGRFTVPSLLDQPVFNRKSRHSRHVRQPEFFHKPPSTPFRSPHSDTQLGSIFFGHVSLGDFPGDQEIISRRSYAATTARNPLHDKAHPGLQ